MSGYKRGREHILWEKCYEEIVPVAQFGATPAVVLTSVRLCILFIQLVALMCQLCFSKLEIGSCETKP